MKIKLIIHWVISIFVILGFLTSFVNADTQLDTKWTKARDLYNAKEYKSALKIWKENVDQGHPKSNHSIGWLYRKGYGVERDLNKAIQYYEKALSLGYANSGYALGYIYENGEADIKKDNKKMINYYLKAAELGNAWGNLRIGEFYRDGNKGLEQNDSKAISYLKKAAELGNAKANALIGSYYDFGEYGLEQNDSKTVSYIKKAAELGDAWANLRMSEFYSDGKKGLEQNTSKAVSYLKKAAELGYGKANARIGLFYRDGKKGFEKDIGKSLTYTKKAAELNYQPDILYLGRLYMEGSYRDRVEPNLNEAEKWLLKGQKLGNKESKKLLKRLRNYREVYGESAAEKLIKLPRFITVHCVNEFGSTTTKYDNVYRESVATVNMPSMGVYNQVKEPRTYLLKGYVAETSYPELAKDFGLQSKVTKHNLLTGEETRLENGKVKAQEKCKISEYSNTL